MCHRSDNDSKLIKYLAVLAVYFQSIKGLIGRTWKSWMEGWSRKKLSVLSEQFRTVVTSLIVFWSFQDERSIYVSTIMGSIGHSYYVYFVTERSIS